MMGSQIGLHLLTMTGNILTVVSMTLLSMDVREMADAVQQREALKIITAAVATDCQRQQKEL
jgi:hypothetical protein